MNEKLNKNITKILVYTLTIFCLFSAIYYFANRLNTNMATVSIKMKQSQTQNVVVYYEFETFNDKDYNVQRLVDANDKYATYEFNIPERYISNIDLQFQNDGVSENVVEIKKVDISTRYSKTHIDEFDNYNLNVGNEGVRFKILDGAVFTKFQIEDMPIIYSLVISVILVIVFRKTINNIFVNSDKSKERIKVAAFVTPLILGSSIMFVSLDEKYSFLLSGAVAQKPQIESYQEILDTSYMKKFEKYLKDQFVYRDTFIEDYYAFNRSLQKNNFNTFYITESNGKDVVLNQVKFNKDSLDWSIDNIVSLNEYLKFNEIPYYYFLAPDASAFTTDLAPDYLKSDAIEMYDYVINELEKEGVETYNLYNYMNEELKGTHESLYYRLDNHWTIETVLDVRDELCNYLIQNGIDLNTDTTFTTTTFEDIFTGGYGLQVAYGYRYNQIKDDYTVAIPNSDYQYTVKSINGDSELTGNFNTIANVKNINHKEKYRSTYGTNFPNPTNSIITNETISNDKTVLVIGDSFSKSMALFLTQNFKRVIMIENSDANSGKTYEFIRDNIEDIDVVIGLNTIESNNGPRGKFDYFGNNVVDFGNKGTSFEITNANAKFDNFYDYKDWSKGDGKVTVNINELDENLQYNLIADMNIYTSVNKMEIYINDVLVDSLEESEVSLYKNLNLEIEQDILHSGENTVYFKVYGADSPKNRGESDDARILGFRINAMRLVEKK